jgi:hypothetical protein
MGWKSIISGSAMVGPGYYENKQHKERGISSRFR